MHEIICSGFGGQGVLTAGLLLIECGAALDQHVSWCPSYGSEMRGGTANCTVIISDEEIGSPYTTAPGILIAMNEPSVDKFQSSVKPGGIIILNSSIIPADKPIDPGPTVYRIPATDIANAAGNPRGANIVMLGALIRVSGMFDKDRFIETIARYFSQKGRHNPQNIDCFNKGYEAVSNRERSILWTSP